MKRVGNLIQEIICFDNLYLAYYKAKKAKEHKAEIVAYAKNLNANLKKLQNQIQTGNVKVGLYHYFTIYEPKEREICAASFQERVLHHAIMNICHPYFEKYLIFDTYATRQNKGTYKALDRAKLFHKKNKWYFKFDIRKYFDSIDHTILLAMLKTMFKDKTLLIIFEKIINSYQTQTGKGLPIGNLTSQYFANRYLGSLDHFVKHNLRTKYYVRYMDDFVIWHNSKQTIIDTAKEIASFIDKKLNLELKYNILNTTKHGLSFLSYRIFQNKIVLTKQAKNRFKNKLAIYTKKLNIEEWSQEEFSNHATALFSFAQHAYTKQFRMQVLQNG